MPVIYTIAFNAAATSFIFIGLLSMTPQIVDFMWYNRTVKTILKYIHFPILQVINIFLVYEFWIEIINGALPSTSYFNIEMLFTIAYIGSMLFTVNSDII